MKQQQHKHTPGPWNVGRSHLRGSDSPNGAGILAADGSLIARMPAVADRNLDEKGANARLIAAAPEMLEALEHVRDGMVESGGWEGDEDVFRVVVRAIAKATGAQEKSR